MAETHPNVLWMFICTVCKYRQLLPIVPWSCLTFLFGHGGERTMGIWRKKIITHPLKCIWAGGRAFFIHLNPLVRIMHLLYEGFSAECSKWPPRSGILSICFPLLRQKIVKQRSRGDIIHSICGNKNLWCSWVFRREISENSMMTVCGPPAQI